MRILGIDPGLEKTGFAVLEVADGKSRLLDFGLIRTEKTTPFSQRLSLIASDLKTLLREWKPNAACIEQVFFSRNVKTAISVSHARGVILEVLEDHGIPVTQLNPSHVKLALTGDARAKKFQMKKMIQYLMGIELKNDDTADAIACCLCVQTPSSTRSRIPDQVGNDRSTLCKTQKSSSASSKLRQALPR